MFDRFTDAAKKVLNLARQAAQRLNHERLGPEHILLGILEVESCAAWSVLDSLPVDVRVLRAEIEASFPPGENIPNLGQLPFAERAKKVLESSMEEAQIMHHNALGTGHLLVALFADEELRSLLSLATREKLIAGVRAHHTEEAGPEGGSGGTRRSLSPLPKLSDEGKRVLMRANDELRRLRSPRLLPEHFLLALLAEEGWVGDLLRDAGLDPAKVIDHLRD